MINVNLVREHFSTLKVVGDIEVVRNQFGYMKYRVTVEVDSRRESFDFCKRPEAVDFIKKIAPDFYSGPGLTLSELNMLIENPT